MKRVSENPPDYISSRHFAAPCHVKCNGMVSVDNPLAERGYTIFFS